VGLALRAFTIFEYVFYKHPALGPPFLRRVLIDGLRGVWVCVPVTDILEMQFSIDGTIPVFAPFIKVDCIDLSAQRIACRDFIVEVSRSDLSRVIDN
jgi:hypothetical protein